MQSLNVGSTTRCQDSRLNARTSWTCLELTARDLQVLEFAIYADLDISTFE